MALQRRLVARAFRRSPAGALQLARRHAASESAPYRPSPADAYQNPKSAQYWLKKYPASSEAEDEYPQEAVYLDEVEARMQRYDAQYRMSARLQEEYNRFGWDDWDDRAFAKYGGAFDQGAPNGRGEKIDPAMYDQAQYVRVSRNPLPPVQYLTPEQIRRSRGRFANLREVVPEPKSVWKTWNIYTTVGAATAILASKEMLILGGHDMWDVVALYGVMGVAMAVCADWIAWWSTTAAQERYDKEWMQLEGRVQRLNDKLETLSRRPNLKATVAQLGFFREHLSERVLQKTLSNQLSRAVDQTIKQLKDKVAEEAAVKADAQGKIRAQALAKTGDFLDQKAVQDKFTKDALAAFTKKGGASIPGGATELVFASDLFPAQYEQNRAAAEKAFVEQQQKAGTLNWVFRPQQERDAQKMSKADMEKEFAKRVKAWEQTHNAVGAAAAPAFSA